MPWKHWRPAVIAASVARPASIALSLAVTVLVSGLMTIWLALVDLDALELFRSQLAFTTDRFIDVLGPLGPDGISEVVRATITLDFVFPVAYAMAIGGLWARFSGSSSWTGPALPLAAALGAAAADWIENALHMAAAAQMVGGSRPSAVLVAIGSLAAVIKWALLIGAIEAAALAAWRRPGRGRLAAVPLALLAGALLAAFVLAAL